MLELFWPHIDLSALLLQAVVQYALYEKALAIQAGFKYRRLRDHQEYFLLMVLEDYLGNFLEVRDFLEEQV